MQPALKLKIQGSATLPSILALDFGWIRLEVHVEKKIGQIGCYDWRIYLSRSVLYAFLISHWPD
jgi:hypothetical protein